MTQKTIGVVGPCAAGKSTLVERLHEAGYRARHIAQEHSFSPSMWQRISTAPDILIFLDVSYPVSAARRPDSRWRQADYEEQQRRLSHARQHADLYIQTDDLTPEEVFRRVQEFLETVDGRP